MEGSKGWKWRKGDSSDSEAEGGEAKDADVILCRRVAQSVIFSVTRFNNREFKACFGSQSILSVGQVFATFEQLVLEGGKC